MRQKISTRWKQPGMLYLCVSVSVAKNTDSAHEKRQHFQISQRMGTKALSNSLSPEDRKE